MECDHCKRDTNQVHMSQCFTFIPRYLLTSGYTSKRRWMVTGIPARASLKVFGSVSQGVFGVRCMRAGFHGNRLPIRVCNIVSPSSASTSFDPLYAAMPSVISHSPTRERTLDPLLGNDPTACQILIYTCVRGIICQSEHTAWYPAVRSLAGLHIEK
jgi:hypothetical protein